jgi:hypothetical protein
VNAYFAFSTLILAALLFVPVSRLILTLSVRRFERRTGQRLGPAEIAGQRRRARVIALVLVLVFAFAFNLRSAGVPH